ncbi:hypothetical protein [Staphylococcus simiae]|uniref:Uncharacterized protein n=1 Tax=Staphylococcus simiae CCM 7213 = CCUG 51256 TaxID=911238 RepID=G5JIX2_9STAP|nr:hypothetical protein [Staphylococcus simiae]EHJ07852.1 hypothetical protein SS7213T_07093 [Staphylococcus simiae CCM 7213 = CCUG 51256]PNZ14057.1 hypothetical protein CD113_03180 [Staphylococcus simiae]SNV79755.1 Uncharacterised protein [Staphylococcus simiae]
MINESKLMSQQIITLLVLLEQMKFTFLMTKNELDHLLQQFNTLCVTEFDRLQTNPASYQSIPGYIAYFETFKFLAEHPLSQMDYGNPLHNFNLLQTKLSNTLITIDFIK